METRSAVVCSRGVGAAQRWPQWSTTWCDAQSGGGSVHAATVGRCARPPQFARLFLSMDL